MFRVWESGFGNLKFSPSSMSSESPGLRVLGLSALQFPIQNALCVLRVQGFGCRGRGAKSEVI